MSEELKSCPFCGGAANIKVATYAKGKYLVECSSEDCPQYTVDTKTVAIKAWNTRAEPELNHEDAEKAVTAYHKAVMRLTGHGENNLNWMAVILNVIKRDDYPLNHDLKGKV